MPPPIHQRSLTYRQLQKHLPLLLERCTRSRQFIEEYKDVYKFPKMIARNNIRRYSKMIKAITFLLMVIDDEVKKR